jgi:hypothetical protein
MKKYGREKLKRLYAAMNTPKGTKFIGYVLHLPESDEFMAMAEHVDNYGSVNYAWAQTPSLALVFKKHIKAVRELQEYGKNNVKLCLLFETETQYFKLDEDEALEILGIK